MKDNLLATIPKLGKEWKITFDFKPIEKHKRNPFQGLLHLTIGHDNNYFGDRTPALWMVEGTTQFHITSAINGHRNTRPGPKTELSALLHTWSEMVISQLIEGGNYIFRFTIGGETAWEINNNTPTEFSDVQVWAADPWNGEAANGFMRGLIIRTNVKPGVGGVELVHNRIDIDKGLDTVVSLAAEMEILKDNLLATIPRLGKEWRLTFDYKPTAISLNGGTLLHLSAGRDNVQYGDPTPYIGHFDGKTTRLVISSAISGDRNKHVRLTQEPPLGSWTTLEASQRTVGLLSTDGRQLISHFSDFFFKVKK